jgi:hypothetical protein
VGLYAVGLQILPVHYPARSGLRVPVSVVVECGFAVVRGKRTVRQISGSLMHFLDTLVPPLHLRRVRLILDLPENTISVLVICVIASNTGGTIPGPPGHSTYIPIPRAIVPAGLIVLARPDFVKFILSGAVVVPTVCVLVLGHFRSLLLTSAGCGSCWSHLSW